MKKLIVTSLALIFLSLPALSSDEDPWEDWNRGVFEFNEVVDKYAAKPVAQAYRNITPDIIDNGITNVFSNLGEPFVVANDLLQGKFVQALSDTGRFLVNSTVGVLGIFDVATVIGLEKHEEDFGQTLGYWGVGPGPYLVLPLLGPSTVRDAAGLGVEFFVLNDLNIAQKFIKEPPAYYSTVYIKYLDVRADLLLVEGIISGDKYTFLRSLYLQRRDYLINDGEAKDEFSDEFDEFDEYEDDFE